LQSTEYKYNLPWVYVKYIIVDNSIEYVKDPIKVFKICWFISDLHAKS